MYVKALDEVPSFLTRKGKGKDEYAQILKNYGLSKGKHYKVVETFYNYPSYTCIVINDRQEAKGIEMSHGDLFCHLFEEIPKEKEDPKKKTTK